MTIPEFRSEALAVPGAVESSHMNHPDFRLHGRIFATLGHPDESWAMMKLNAEQQAEMVDCASHVFSPANGAWGKQGSTKVFLPAATKPLVRQALSFAFKNSQAALKRPLGFKP